MDNDDQPVGRILSRREILGLVGRAGAAALMGYSWTRAARAAAQTGSSTTSCVVKTAVTEGRYWIDEMLNRSDIRSDPTTGAVKQGVPLEITFNVSRIGGSTCTPLVGGHIDIWHCDALGVHSDVQMQNSVGQKFLRGYQLTNSDGQARFTTIFPGWYQGRTVHIHFRIRTSGGGYQSSNFVSQIFFDDALTDKIHAQQPYAAKGQRDTRNSTDMIYQQGGSSLLLPLTASGDGYAGAFNLGVTVGCADLAKGDINADESVTVADATEALRTAVGLDSPNDCALSAADMNGDGIVDIRDVTAILQKAVGL